MSEESPAEQTLRLEKELARAHEELDRLKSELAARVGPGETERQTLAEGALFISEVEVRKAIARQLRNGARLLRATKCIYMLFDGSSELVAQRPALGLEDEQQLLKFRVPVSRGISGEVFRTRKPARLERVQDHPRASEEYLAEGGVTNGICVPLQVQIRDEENRVIDTRVIGVLWVMNRRDIGGFTADDERLLTVFARQVAAVVANAEFITNVVRENQALVSTFENLPAGILYIGDDEQVRLINGTARQIFGVEEGRGVGEPYYRLIQQQKIVEVLGSVLREGSEMGTEVPLPVGDEERIFQVQAARVRDADEQISGVVAILGDVTEIHRLERLKQEFVQTFTNELLGPLSSIRAFSSMLGQVGEDQFDFGFRRDCQRIVTDECNRLRRHIQDLLNVSRVEQGIKLHLNVTRFNLQQLLERVIEHQRAQTGNHELTFLVEDEIGLVGGDEQRLEEVAFNLLSNAVKYSPDGGTIEVRLMQVEHGYRVEVSDQGVGIPEEVQEQVFQKFTRVESSDERVSHGRGIGLFISRVFVEAHGGRIGLRSKPGSGSTFWFQVPNEPPVGTDNGQEAAAG